MPDPSDQGKQSSLEAPLLTSSSAFFRHNIAAHPPLDLPNRLTGTNIAPLIVARVSSLHEPSLRLRRACSGSRQHISASPMERFFGELSHNIVGGRRNSGSDIPPLLRTSRSSALFQQTCPIFKKRVRSACCSAPRRTYSFVARADRKTLRSRCPQTAPRK